MAAAKEEALELAREVADQAQAIEEEEVWAWDAEALSDDVWKHSLPPPQRTRTKRTTAKARAVSLTAT